VTDKEESSKYRSATYILKPKTPARKHVATSVLAACGMLHGSHKYFLFMNNTMVAMNIYYYHSVMVTIMVVVINC
jgi:hypothetical protein